MNKYKDIIEGWSNLLIKKDTIENIAIPRLDICANCEFNKHKPNINILSTCGKCGCTLEAKTRCLNCKCPENKW